jgi:predicted chitinase
VISESLLRKMMPNAGARLEPHLPYIGLALEEGRINTPKRIAAFVAQLAHESGEYRYMEELASGDDYDTRTDLGNTPEIDGDGRTYKGRGPMQITGKNNYIACGAALGVDLIDDVLDPDDDLAPDKLMWPQYATRSAVWFWNSRRLSLLADRDWFKTITRAINGGLNGFSDRRLYWDRNRALLGLPLVDTGQEAADIMAFQRSRGLVADGVAGPKTFAALVAAAPETA